VTQSFFGVASDREFCAVMLRPDTTYKYNTDRQGKGDTTRTYM
jgi:hypothetical protein